MKKNTRDVNVLRVGFMTGYYTRYDVSCWVDEQILKEDQPSNELIELSLLKTKNEQEIEFLLRQLGDARDPVQDFKYAIGFVGLLFETRKLSLSVAVQTLFNWSHRDGLVDVSSVREETRAINGLDYATEFIMTAPGELSNEVERELLEFTNPYAEQIRSVNLFHKDLDSRLRLY